MAIPEHLNVISQGVPRWNEWRHSHPEVLHPDLSDARLSRTDLREVNFERTNLFGADLDNCDLRTANLERADLGNALLRHTDFREAKFHRLTVLTQANLFAARFENTDLQGATFVDSDLEAANFEGADLTGTDLTYARLRRANLSGATLREASLVGAFLEEANLEGAKLQGANLSLSTLVKTNLANADLSGAVAFGVAVWKVNLQGATQINLRISDERSPRVTVDDLQIAQFVYLLLNYENLKNMLDAVSKRGVLILGRFGGGGLPILRNIADALRKFEYLPMVFEFQKPEDRTYTETVRTLAGLARFVVVDLSGPSVPQELYATVPHLKIPFVPILEKGRQPYSMFTDLLEYDWVLKPVMEFSSTEDLLNQLQSKVIQPAEKRVLARQAQLRELFGS